MKKILIAASFLGLGLSLGAGPASAADCPFSTPAVAHPACSIEVKPVTLTPSSPAVQPKAQTPTASPSLPVTGAETAVLASTGALMIVGGALLVARSRRSTDVA